VYPARPPSTAETEHLRFRDPNLASQTQIQTLHTRPENPQNQNLTPMILKFHYPQRGRPIFTTGGLGGGLPPIPPNPGGGRGGTLSRTTCTERTETLETEDPELVYGWRASRFAT